MGQTRLRLFVRKDDCEIGWFQLGLRLGEILSLTWDQRELNRGFIKLWAADTKTGEPRLVPLTPAVTQSLRELAKVRKLSCYHVYQYKGKPIKRIRRAFRSAVKRARIEDLRFHDLRHCAATNLRRAGVDSVTAMRIIGHKSERMHRRYNAVAETDLTKAASKLNSCLSNTLITPASDSKPEAHISA